MKHFFQFRSDDEFIGESQRWESANLAAAHRRAVARLRRAAWLFARELRELEQIHISHAENARLPGVDADRTAPVMKDWDNGAARDGILSCTIVVQSATDSGFDVALTVESRSNGFSLDTAESTAVSRAVFDEPIYFQPSLSDMSSAGAEPHLALEAPRVLVPPTLDALTVRQRDVLSLMMRGMSNKEIARALKLAEGTVKIHVSALFRKFGAHHRAAAAVVGAQLFSQRQ
jgi:DNA-binding NarL/FixJ family response regulator